MLSWNAAATCSEHLLLHQHRYMLHEHATALMLGIDNTLLQQHTTTMAHCSKSVLIQQIVCSKSVLIQQSFCSKSVLVQHTFCSKARLPCHICPSLLSTLLQSSFQALRPAKCSVADTHVPAFCSGNLTTCAFVCLQLQSTILLSGLQSMAVPRQRSHSCAE